MESLVRHLQEVQCSQGAFEGKAEEVLQQLAALEEIDIDFGRQKVVRRAAHLARSEVRPLLDNLAPDGVLQETSFETAVAHVEESDRYQKYVERIRRDTRRAVEQMADECTAVSGYPYIFAAVTSAVERNPNRATSGSVAQIFTLDDEFSENGDLDPVQFHASLKETMESLGGVVVETEHRFLNDSYAEKEHTRPAEKDDPEQRLAALAVLSKMAADVTDTECWPSVRENLIAALLDPHPHVAAATLRTLVEVAKTAEHWQLAQLAVTICTQLTPLFQRNEEEGRAGAQARRPHGADEDALLLQSCETAPTLDAFTPEHLLGVMKFLHTTLRSVEASWMFLSNVSEVFQGLSELLSYRTALRCFARIDPTAAWFEAFARCGGLRPHLFSQSALLLLCAKVAFCEPFDTHTASVGALTSQQRCHLLHKLTGVGDGRPTPSPHPEHHGYSLPNAASPSPGTPNPTHPNLSHVASPSTHVHPRTPGRGSDAGDATAAQGAPATPAPHRLSAEGQDVEARTLSTTPSHGRGVGGAATPDAAQGPAQTAAHGEARPGSIGTRRTPHGSASRMSSGTGAVGDARLAMISTVGSTGGVEGRPGSHRVGRGHGTAQRSGSGGLPAVADEVADEDALVLHAVHIMGMCLIHPDGVARFPLVIAEGSLMPLHMFATRSTTTSLLLADEFLVASSAVHGIILHVMRGLYYPPPCSIPAYARARWCGRQKQLASLAHACMTALLRRPELEAPVTTLLAVNYILPVLDLTYLGTVAAFESEAGCSGTRAPLGRRPEIEDSVIGAMRFLAELALHPKGRHLLAQRQAAGTLPGEADSLLGVVVRFLATVTRQPWGFSEAVLREVPALAAALLRTAPAGVDTAKGLLSSGGAVDLPAFALDPPERIEEVMDDPHALAVLCLDGLLDALGCSATMRVVVSHQRLVAALAKRAAVRTLAGQDGCERLPLLTHSADLLVEVNGVQGLPGPQRCLRYWEGCEGVAHFRSAAKDVEINVAREVWVLLRASMLCSTTWQTKFSLLKPTVASVLSTESAVLDADVHVSELSGVAAATVMMLDSTLVLLTKYDAQRVLLSAQQNDSSLHPASLLRHIMMCSLGVIGGPSERHLPRTAAFGWPYLFVLGPWQAPPALAGALGEVCESHCGVLISDCEASDPPVMVSAPEVSDDDPTPLHWSYPNAPSVLRLAPLLKKPDKLDALTASLRSALEKLASAEASGMDESRKEWLDGINDIIRHAVRSTKVPTAQTADLLEATPKLLAGGAAVHTRQLFLCIMQFVKNSWGASAATGGTQNPEPHAHAHTAAAIGIRYGIALGLIDGSEQAHIQTLRAHLPDIHWVTIVLYLVGGEPLMPLLGHPALRFFGGETNNTLRLTTAVEHVLLQECESLVSFLNTHCVPLFFVVHVWTRQVFLNFLDWPEVLAAVTLTLLHGPEDLVFILALCVLHMRQLLLSTLAHPDFCPSYLATFVAVTAVVDAKGEPFSVAQHLDALHALKARHAKHVAKLLS